MEIKAQLTNYTTTQRQDFIVTYNHNLGYEIKEYTTSETKQEEVENPETGEMELVEYTVTTKHIEAWGKTDEEKAEEERARLDNLSMTRGDVFEALILAKGLGKAQIRAMIEKAELDTVTKALYLNRFDEALEFYRGYPIFDMLGQALGITSEMLDKFFQTKDYHELITKEVENENTTDTTESDIQDELDTTESGTDETDTDILE